MTSKEIRKQFLDFFASKKHKIVASAPLVNKDDPTLMFINAGMNPFKEFFLGQKKIIDNKITDTQKCLRVSGKHNDLEEVGMDTYHHTMFEMLGNWSFGDPANPERGYFKKEAISYAWELLTDVFKIDKNDLYVTVFEGSKEDKLDFDQEAFDNWAQYIDTDRILNGTKKDNFWEMGAQGPCGPCSEIHVDIRPKKEKEKIPGKDLINKDHPQVVELWNLVFIEFNRKSDGSLEKLPAKHIDTGMGFERLCMVLQNKQSNYDTDVFSPIIREIEVITGNIYGKNNKTDVAIRVIADHIRAVAFAIADGQLPSNNGAGYVIRRILRRAIRYGFTFLDKKEAFIYKLVNVLDNQMGSSFPELKSQKRIIAGVIREEEKSFLRTLDQGLTMLDVIIKNTKGNKVSGVKGFELYDTYGFPKDLTALILREKGLEFDEDEFAAQMEKQKSRSRKAASLDTSDWVILIDDDTEEFIGYDQLQARVKITRYRKVTTKKDGEMYQLVFNYTPFYPEGGGQVGDKGVLRAENGDDVYIVDTKKENNLILHFTKTLPADVNQIFEVIVGTKERFRTQCNHTATHLLHQALRTVLGNHVEQRGSFVSSKGLRFDFSHFSKLTDKEIKEVEDFVNARINEKLDLIENRNIPIDDAKKEGALMLFGEKYGDTVRTIKFGTSIELCGGTHVKNTGDIWYFKILSESAIAAGIRRIEAITHSEVKDYFVAKEKELNQIKKSLKNPSNLIKAIENINNENIKLKKEIEQLLKEKAGSLKGDLIKNKELINGINFIATKVDLDATTIKNLAFDIANKVDNLFFIAGSKLNDKAILTIYISKNLVSEKGLNAGQIVKELGRFIQGGGGGQPFFATAGGKNPDGIQEALKKAKEFIK